MDKVKQVRLDFSNSAGSYDAYAHIQQEVGSRLLARLQFINFKPKTILDLGCGTGFCGQHLQKMYPEAHIINLDIALNMCKLAATKNSISNNTICADIYNLPIKANSIDLVISNFTLQWCENLDALFVNIKKITKPAGVLLFTTVGLESLKQLRHSWQQVDNYPRVNNFVDMHQVGDSLMYAGWQQPLIDVDRITKFYPQIMQLLLEFKALGVTNKAKARTMGLTGKNKFKLFIAEYEKFREELGLPVSWEIIYGFAKAPSGVNFTP